LGKPNGSVVPGAVLVSPVKVDLPPGKYQVQPLGLFEEQLPPGQQRRTIAKLGVAVTKEIVLPKDTPSE